MVKASIVRDAIAYVEHLQEQERRVLDDIAALQSAAAAAVKTVDVATVGATDDVDSFFPQMKRMRRAISQMNLWLMLKRVK